MYVTVTEKTNPILRPIRRTSAMARGYNNFRSRASKVPKKDPGVFGMLNSASDAVGSLSSLYGSFSGGYGKKKDDCEGISLATLLTTFAGIAVTFFAVFTKLTMLGKRKKRSAALELEDDTDAGIVVENFQDFIHQGTRGK